jgi:membrane-associated phospholipid phosphatase
MFTQAPPEVHLPVTVRSSRSALPWLAAAAGLVMLLVLVGLIAKTAALTRMDLRVDRHLVTMRGADLTVVFKGFTMAAQSAVGVALAVLVPAWLLLARRREDALRVFCLIAGALVLAYLTKSVVTEHRPPSALWVVRPDTRWSFPSGHSTVAAAAGLAMVVIARRADRPLAAVVAVALAFLVGWARVYLGVHYPLDVLGGYLCAVTAFVAATGFVALPFVRRLAHLPDSP